MSRTSVRTAVVNWLGQGNVANLNNVYASRLRASSDDEMTGGQLSTETTSGAIAFVRIGDQRETRVALGGLTSGKKRVDYIIDLVVEYHTSGIALDTQNVEIETDALIDALLTRIRVDRTFATATILEAGEGPTGIGITEPNFSETSENEFTASFVCSFVVTEIVTT